ncbi:MAG: nifU protein [Candidatus Xenolissoclinum pacificiensis L6]|uniref:Iron-sulfur cluster assembly scaffold protein IscU n=1 Tax=Candidatus Xenolissoclinum pacificiensis L6 TaxID=1401685 RepID=W2V0E2_9RICK|nr:MAG: nifU protein [Candidatus Xenolissoclinum pacificiensis L6]
MSYSKKVIEIYENPENVGSLDETSSRVGTGLVGAPACGDVMKLQIEVGDDGKIVDVKFKTYGCGSAIASSSMATQYIKGRDIQDALLITNAQIAEELELPPVKRHCSVLAQDAIKAAVDDYKRKNQQKSGESDVESSTLDQG